MPLKVTRSVPGPRFALSLALITVLAPAATDMYLASMPDIARHMNVPYAAVQVTLTLYLLAQGVGQLFFGPLIDRYGRRVPLLLGLAAFIASSIWAASSEGILILSISRFAQGLSGALLLVIGFSSVRDVAQSTQAARLFAILLTIEGLAPVFAPIAGGYVDANLGWRAVLLVSAGMGAFALANSYFSLPESLPQEKRMSLKPSVIAATYRRIALDTNFLLPTLTLSAVFFYLFAYIGGAAFLYQNVYGLSPDDFGLVFGASGAAVMAGAMTSSRMMRTRKVSEVGLTGLMLIIAGSGIALGASILLPHGMVSLGGIVAGFAVALFGLGIAEPSFVSLTMASQKQALGFTAALMGAMHLVLSSLSTPISGMLLPKGQNLWLAFLLISACGTLALGIMTRRNLLRSGSEAAPGQAAASHA